MFLLFVALFAFSNAAVEVLTDDTFQTFIDSNQYVLVEFYAPWCGHCKRLEPEYNEAAAELEAAGSEVKLAKVDCTVETGLSSQFSIRGYPTLKFFKGGVPTEYDGGRTAPELVSWVGKKSGPPSKHLTTQEEIDAFTTVTGKTSKVVAYGPNDEDWKATANNPKLAAFVFGHVTDEALFGGRTAGTVVLYKSDDKITYDGVLPLAKWLISEGFPLVDQLSQESWTRAMEAQTDILAVFLADKDDHSTTINAIAKEFKADFSTTWSTQKDIGTRWGTSGNLLPTAIYVKNNNGSPAFVVWNEDTETSFDLEGLKRFVKGAQDGSYDGYIKSEPIPEDSQGPVKVVVAKTFESIVLGDKDVFVEFYAPWCGHCKKLAPVYEELGAAFQGDDSVVIAKFDATANGLHKTVKVEGFPTLVLFKADGTRVSYEGNRELDDMTKFINENRTPKTVVPPTPEHEDL